LGELNHRDDNNGRQRQNQENVAAQYLNSDIGYFHAGAIPGYVPVMDDCF
jgi:hypothetical protein